MQPYDSNMETCLVFCKDINSVVPKWKKYEIKVNGEFRKDIFSGYTRFLFYKKVSERVGAKTFLALSYFQISGRGTQVYRTSA